MIIEDEMGGDTDFAGEGLVSGRLFQESAVYPQFRNGPGNTLVLAFFVNPIGLQVLHPGTLSCANPSTTPFLNRASTLARVAGSTGPALPLCSTC